MATAPSAPASTTEVSPAENHDASAAHPPAPGGEDVEIMQLPPLPSEHDEDDSFLQQDFNEGATHNDSSVIENREMKRQLMDIESSFLPEPTAHIEQIQGKGADDTYLFGGSPGNAHQHSEQEAEEGEGDSALERVMANLEELTKPKKKPKKIEVRSGNTPTKAKHSRLSSIASEDASEPPTPADAYKTPAVRQHDHEPEETPETSTSTADEPPSSPTAEAALRNQSRQVPTQDTYDPPVKKEHPALREAKSISDMSQRPTSSASTIKAAPDFSQLEEGSSLMSDHNLSLESIMDPGQMNVDMAPRSSKRPSFLQNRHSSQRSSVSSFTNHSDISGDDASTASLGADYALQTGGAVPRPSLPNRSSMALSRLPSLGSIASSMSTYSETTNTWDKNRAISSNSLSGLLHGDASLSRVIEENLSTGTPPETPRAPSVQPSAPTDTVIARHVQDIQVPDTIAREFRAKHSRSPDKRHAATPFTRSKHNLTLKEQNSKIDKLSKENFDLKLKIHFLDQALQNRSDEGVKDMIGKNVQLQTDLATEKKDNQTLRKKVRDLERKLKAYEEGNVPGKESGSGSDDEKSDRSSGQAELIEEIEFLRERLESSETVIEQWEHQNLQHQADIRRMSDYIKAMRDKNPSGESAGLNEAIDLWKGDFEDERARREQVETRCQQAEADAELLRAEVQRLKEQNLRLVEQPRPSSTQHFNRLYSNTRRINQTSTTTHSNSGSESNERGPQKSNGGTSVTFVEQLQVDNEKLQRDLLAQTSMLTSRHKENQRLREENEGLKLTIRKGDSGSIAGDSILERSISRNHMRSVSRASGNTRMTQMSDPDRDDMETKYAAARDEVSQLKLGNKELEDQLNGHLDMLETAEQKVAELEREIDESTQDLQALQHERDELMGFLEEKEQECEELRQEAVETVERLENDLEQTLQDREQLLVQRDNIQEDFDAIQQEMKHVSESLVAIEDDRDASLRKIQNLETELTDANQELMRQDKLLNDERSKVEKLEVQIESCQGEIDFLREEQEGDKIKIGELESAYNSAQITMRDDKERYRDLEIRVGEERQQREALDSQEKHEVEKIITDLNSQLSKLKEDSRRLRKNLSGKEVEAANWKHRLDELETNLREVLGNLNGSRSSLLKDVHKLQRDYEASVQELDAIKTDLAEKDRLLRSRDVLLENTGLESRRLAELLERERLGRRQDKNTFETATRGHQSVSRTVQQHETRVLELETMRSQDRQRLHTVEKQYKEQLLERNNLLYALWNRLSTLCGAEWCRNNALISGELTSMELISKNIQGFNKNIILAVKTVEGVIGGFKIRIRATEKDLIRDYQTLEHSLEVRIKRVDQLEKLVQAQRQSMSIGRPSTVRGGLVETNSAEITKLRTENKTLRTEVQTLRAITITSQNHEALSRTSSRNGSPSSSKRASMAQTLLRTQSASVVEQLQNQGPSHPYPAAGPLQASEQKWIHRLKELERRLKAEREARLSDRTGARKRLEEKNSDLAKLQAKIDKAQELGFEGMIDEQRSTSATGVRTGRSGRQSVVGSTRDSRSNEREDFSTDL